MTVDAATTSPLVLSPFQERAAALPESLDLFLGGGRGGGKSYLLAVLAMRHAEQYGARARALYLRQSFPGVRDFEQLTLELYAAVYGKAATWNGADKLWRFPSGGTLELNQLETVQQLTKYQGRSITLLLADEAGEWAEASLLDRMRGNLRSGGGVPVRMVMAANPGGPGHGWIHKRHVAGKRPWRPYREESTGAQFVTCPSTFRDNPAVDHDAYRRQLEAATATDAELRKAWLSGDWNIARGAYFADVLGDHNVVDWPADSPFWRIAGQRRSFVFEIALDHGSAAPGVCYLVARSHGGHGPDRRWYPRGSVVLVDEVATNAPGSLTDGMQYSVERTAEEIVRMCKRYEVRAHGVADDACFSAHGHRGGSLAAEYRRYGVRLKPARKGDRIVGWTRLKRLMADAGKPDRAGLYVDRRCEYFWLTVPFLQRDPRRVEDLATNGPDHAADAARYACGKPERRGGGAVRIPV